jgi:hypothetical protein
MTIDETQVRNQAVKEIIHGVARKTALIVSLATAAVLVFTLVQKNGGPWWFLPASVLFGGALGLLNFRWLATAVQRIYLRPGATAAGSKIAAAVFSLLKLSLIFIILFVVIKWRFLHVLGLVAGLSLCFLAILWEGTTNLNQAMKKDDGDR